jgi:Putative Actinobacterial Holin-X, holin superfamily III
VNWADRSSVEVAQDIAADARELVHLEVALVKRELRELAIRNGIAIGLIVFGTMLLVLAVLVALPVFLVLLWDMHVLGAAIWLGVYVVLGAGLVLGGRLALRLGLPPRTLRSLEETKEWALRLIRSSSR